MAVTVGLSLVLQKAENVNYVVSVWRGFLFLCVLGMGYVILLSHSLSLALIIYQEIGGCYKGTIILQNSVSIRSIPFKCILYVLKKHLCEEKIMRNSIGTIHSCDMKTQKFNSWPVFMKNIR